METSWQGNQPNDKMESQGMKLSYFALICLSFEAACACHQFELLIAPLQMGLEYEICDLKWVLVSHLGCNTVERRLSHRSSKCTCQIVVTMTGQSVTLRYPSFVPLRRAKLASKAKFKESRSHLSHKVSTYIKQCT